MPRNAWLRRRSVALLVTLLSAACSGRPTGDPPAFEARLPATGINNVWWDDNSSDTVFVFVHGILSDSRTCWFYQDPSHRDRNQYWPELVRTDKRLGSPSIFLAGYHTSVDSTIATMTDAALELHQGLNATDGVRPPPMTKRRIVFITHSTGGIVVRYLLERFQEEFKSKIVGLMLIASPSGGSEWANKLSLLVELYRNRMAAELRIDDGMLKDIDSRFRQFVYDQKLPGLVGIEAFENYFIFHYKWYPDKNVVVNESSAVHYFGAGRLLPDTDHFTTVKPRDSTSPAHRLLVEFYSGEFSRKVKQIEQPIVRSDQLVEITSATAPALATQAIIAADRIVVSGVDFHPANRAQLRANRLSFKDNGGISGKDFTVIADELAGGWLAADGQDGAVGQPGGGGGHIVVYGSRITDLRISARGGRGGRGPEGSPVGQAGGPGGEIFVVTSSAIFTPPPDVTGGHGGEGSAGSGGPVGFGPAGQDGHCSILDGNVAPPLRSSAISGGADRLRQEIAQVLRDNLSVENAMRNARLQFSTGSAELSPWERTKLDDLAALLKKNPEYGAVVTAEGDSHTAVDFNIGLKQRRAASVQWYLLSRGVDQRQLRSVSSESPKRTMERTSAVHVFEKNK